jgi:CBS domain-containing protein
MDMLAAPGLVLGKLAYFNISIALFNLLPAFPMDGGRILRAILATRMPYPKATQTAAGLGQLLAIVLGFIGLLANPFLILIALFVFIGATEEGSRVQTETLIEGVSVREAMVTDFMILQRADTLGKAVAALLAGTQHDFPVVEGVDVVGILTRRRLFEALHQKGQDIYVSEVMEEAPEPVAPESPLDEVLSRMAADSLTLVPVHSGEGLVGLLTQENTAEFILVRAALKNKPGGRDA